MSKLKVAVFGLGPTGVLAAKAAEDMGCEVEVFALSKHWTPPGSFWLHWLPSHVASDFTFYPIYVAGVGTAKDYFRAQWGRLVDNWSSSFPEKDHYTYGYNPQEVFPTIMPKKIIEITHPMTDADMVQAAERYDVVFQTFPTQHSQYTQLAKVSYHVGVCPGAVFGPDRVIYYGEKQSLVIRETYLWGRKYLEFPKGLPKEEILKAPSVQAIQGIKLIELSDLDPRTKPYQPLGKFPKNIHLIGRWAEWNTKRLSHETYILATEILEEYNG